MGFDRGSSNGFFVEKNWAINIAEEIDGAYAGLDLAMMKASRNALIDASLEWKNVLRSLVVTAGLARSGAGSGRGTGSSLASAIRFELYPRDLATSLSPKPAAFLYIRPDAVKIFRAFEQAVTISPRYGKYLAIPIPGSPADRKNFGRGASRSFRVPSENGTSVYAGVLGAMKAKGLDIIVVPARRGRPAMLVAVSARIRSDKAGRLKLSNAARTKKGGFATGAQTIPLFFLVPKARMPKKLSLKDKFDSAGRSFLSHYSELFDAEMRFAVKQRQQQGKKTRGAWEQWRGARRS